MGLLLGWVLGIYKNINVREKEVWDIEWWILFPGIIHICWIGSLIFESVTQWGISLKMWICSIGLWITVETMVVEITQGKHTMWEGNQCYNGTQSRVIEIWDYKREVQYMGNLSGYRKVLNLKKKWPLSSWLCFLPDLRFSKMHWFLISQLLQLIGFQDTSTLWWKNHKMECKYLMSILNTRWNIPGSWKFATEIQQ